VTGCSYKGNETIESGVFCVLQPPAKRPGLGTYLRHLGFGAGSLLEVSLGTKSSNNLSLIIIKGALLNVPACDYNDIEGFFQVMAKDAKEFAQTPLNLIAYVCAFFDLSRYGYSQPALI
jgi:hypothetical protein